MHRHPATCLIVIGALALAGAVLAGEEATETAGTETTAEERGSDEGQRPETGVRTATEETRRYVVVTPPLGEDGICRVVADPKEIERGSSVMLEIVNLSGETVQVMMRNDIADTAKPLNLWHIDHDQSLLMRLKTEMPGTFFYEVEGLGDTTCLKNLPTPKIVIP